MKGNWQGAPGVCVRTRGFQRGVAQRSPEEEGRAHSGEGTPCMRLILKLFVVSCRWRNWQ